MTDGPSWNPQGSDGPSWLLLDDALGKVLIRADTIKHVTTEIIGEADGTRIYADGAPPEGFAVSNPFAEVVETLAAALRIIGLPDLHRKSEP